MISVSRLLHEVRENFTLSDYAARKQTQGEHTQLNRNVFDKWVKKLTRAGFTDIDVDHGCSLGPAVNAYSRKGYVFTFYYRPEADPDFPIEVSVQGYKRDLPVGGYQTIETAIAEAKRIGVRWMRANDEDDPENRDDW